MTWRCKEYKHRLKLFKTIDEDVGDIVDVSSQVCFESEQTSKRCEHRCY